MFPLSTDEPTYPFPQPNYWMLLNYTTDVSTFPAHSHYVGNYELNYVSALTKWLKKSPALKGVDKQPFV